jgi:N-acetylmannosamine-6-phosphate 2-epimerase/N-acetylmannosamine kinase
MRCSDKIGILDKMPIPIDLKLRGRLIVSCQASANDPMRDSAIIARFARAAELGGAAAIRAEGVADTKAVRAAVKLPILGIRKAVQPDGSILITPSFEDAAALVEAGADMIALDCTVRGQGTGALDRLKRVREELRVPVCADIATVEEAVAAAQAGADFVLSTLRGYTKETADVRAFDQQFIADLVRTVQVPVIAEGRIHNPAQARAAVQAGAIAVVVGTAISRPRDITRSFVKAIEKTWAEVHGNSMFVGIDMGGTNTKFGLVSQNGVLLFQDTTPTPAGGGRGILLEHLKRSAFGAIERAQRLGHSVRAVGIATAGWVDTQTGTVAYATENLPGWMGTEIRRELAAALKLPIGVENDANALALAEKCFGGARDLQDFVCITLGTGVGGGCYIGGRLNRGAHYFANAIGHMTLVPEGVACNCGNRGCLEVYTNAEALTRYAGAHTCARDVIEAANAGEAGAVQAIHTLAGYLAQGCASIIQLLDPEAIFVSGGVAQDNPILFATLTERLKQLVPTWALRRLLVAPSRTGYHGGVLGAAASAIEQLEYLN